MEKYNDMDKKFDQEAFRKIQITLFRELLNHLENMDNQLMYILIINYLLKELIISFLIFLSHFPISFIN